MNLNYENTPYLTSLYLHHYNKGRGKLSDNPKNYFSVNDFNSILTASFNYRDVVATTSIYIH